MPEPEEFLCSPVSRHQVPHCGEALEEEERGGKRLRPLKSKLIIVVDDNTTNLKLLWVLLTKEGYTVRTFTRAEDVLDVLEDVHPDLFLLDMHLPGMDGPTLMRRLKADPITQVIPIVALTASYTRGEGAREARAAGADGFLLKPIEVDTFLESIQPYLEEAGTNTSSP
jgi:two-component system cell cycle response regulator DivK